MAGRLLCGECRVKTTGGRVTHCRECHATFTTHGNFDRHLSIDYAREPAVKCQQPEDVGMAVNTHGHYRVPIFETR